MMSLVWKTNKNKILYHFYMYYKLKFVILFLRFVHNMFFISVKQGKKMSFLDLNPITG